MSRSFGVGAALLTLFLAMLVASPAAMGADHVISTRDLHQALIDSAASRQANLSRVEAFFSSKRTQRALRASGLDLKQVEQAVPALSDQELAQLAKQSARIDNRFAAGALTNQELTYIVIALATAVIVILIVKA